MNTTLFFIIQIVMIFISISSLIMGLMLSKLLKDKDKNQDYDTKNNKNNTKQR